MTPCPRCGEDNPDRARFCLACGLPLTAEATERREVRKTVTVVFTDVSGSTAIGERLDPESLRRLMSRYFEEMRAVLERHGGSVEKFIGDAVMAVFGVPVLHEDDALRAVRAAGEMREALARLNQDLEREWGVQLQVRTGVNTGEVVAGDPSTGQSLVVGDTVNVAARLEQTARPGEILIGDTTLRLVRDAVEVEPTDPLPLRGKAEPVPAFRLLRVLPGVPAFIRRLDSPMVGRERERLLLNQAFERAAEERTCHLFTILGAAGVGKSRLAAELVAACRLRSRVFTGRCLPYGEGITFWPVVEVVRDSAGISEEDAPQEARHRIEVLLKDQHDAALVAERVAQVVGLAELPTETEETFWAVRRFLEALAREEPLVVILDDIHWAEPTLLDLIEHVADWSRDAPILLVCLARPELLDARRAWGGGKLNATSINLEPLSPEESALLMANLLGRTELSDEARRRITEAAEGNPLFVEEMLSKLIDDGLLRKDDGRWVPTRDLSDVSVPPTIQALLASRLDRLRPEERVVIERASVEGRVFHRGAVRELTPDNERPALAGHLQTLVRKELVRPNRAEFVGEDAFAFRHLLIRDAAYQGMPKETRADLHARFASWLERVAGARLAEYEEIVGYHLEQAHRYRSELGPVDRRTAELGGRAAEHLARAGRRALARGDAPAAVNLLRRAAGMSGDADPKRPRLLLDLGTALFEAGEFGPSEGVMADAIEASRSTGDQITEWLARMGQHEIRINTDPSDTTVAEAQEAVERAVQVFEEAGNDAGLAKAWWMLAIIRWLGARAGETADALERAVAHARLARDRRAEAEGLAFLAMTASWAPTTAEDGLLRIEEILARSGGHRKVEAFALITSGVLRAHQGHVDEGRELVARGRGILQELGLRVLAAATAHGAGHVEMWAGDLVRAEQELRASFDALDQMGEKAYLSTTAGYLADVLYRLGRYEEAERFTRIGEEAADPQDLASQILWRSIRAKVLAQRGSTEEAERLAGDGVHLAEDTDFEDMLAQALLDLAEVLRLSGRAAEGIPLAERALGLFERKGHVVPAEWARERLAELQAS